MASDQETPELLEFLLQASKQYYHLLPFLEACCTLAVRDAGSAIADARVRSRAGEILVQNLLIGSSQLRIHSLKPLKRLRGDRGPGWVEEAIELLLEICKLEYTPTNVRKISMLLRRLPKYQEASLEESWVPNMISYSCLGLLRLYHEQTRTELCAVIGEVVNDTSMEDTIFDIIVSWLRSSGSLAVSQVQSPLQPERLTAFECSNLMMVENETSKCFEMFLNPQERLRELAESAHQLQVTPEPGNARSLALQLLLEMPSLAEKRSRYITPVFLEAQFQRLESELTEHSLSSNSSHTLSPDIGDKDWSFQDRKMFLLLLGKCQNPKLLYRAPEVYDKLLGLLSNGNSAIRKLSLQAILKWKHAALLKHDKLLLQVIDDKITNTDLGPLLSSESGGSTVPSEERAVLLPVLLRLIYGSIVGRSGSNGSQEARRKSILRMLFHMHESEIQIFLDVVLGRLKDLQMPSGAHGLDEILSLDLIPSDQQYGFLTMVLSLLETLGNEAAGFGHGIVPAVLYCTIRGFRGNKPES